MFALVKEAVASILPVERLVVAPQSVPLCGKAAAMVSIEDLADRSPRALADGEEDA